MSTQDQASLPIYDLQSRAREARGGLSPASRTVVDYLLAHPESVVFQSAIELGRLTGTSDATVIRTVKLLGYSGLDELRSEMRSAIDSRLSPLRRLHQSLDWAGATPEQILDSTLSLHATMISDARETLSPDVFAAAVADISTAHRVVVYGIGALGSIASYLSLRLLRIGFETVSSDATGFALADIIVGLSEGDVVVVFAYDSLSREIDVLVDEARTRGALVILVTDTLDRMLGGRAHRILNAPVIKTEQVTSFTTPLLVADAIALAVTAARRARSEAAVADLHRVRGLLGREDLD